MGATADSDGNRRRNLGYFLDDAVARLPDKVAIIDLWGGKERQYTYAQLDQRMGRVAAMLARLGVQPGERVALVSGNRVEFLEIFFGAMRAGIIPVLINNRLGADTLKFILEDAQCAAALIDPASHRDVAAMVAAMPFRQRIALDGAFAGRSGASGMPEACFQHDAAPGFLDYETEMAKPASVPAPPPIDDDTQAFQPYTSGSTGRPKGAIMTHRGMIWYIGLNQRCWPSRESDRGMVALPLFHKNALRGTVKPMLYAGGSFVLMPGYEARAYLEALAKYRCTYSRGVAAVFTTVLQQRDLVASLDLTALKGMTIGSAVVTPELLDAVERALPGVRTSESYGLTEGGSPFRSPTDGQPTPRGSVGVLSPEVEVRLVDVSLAGASPADQPDARGNDHDSFGEVWIRCPYVCLGYHNQPDVTAAKLTPDGWLKTGDVFFKDAAGFYYFRSRVDDMFSCGGENVFPKEVENLLFQHPDVVNCVVTPVPHAVKGLAPAAMVVVKPGSGVSGADLKAYCLEKGAAYAHPRHVEIVEALPLNGAGKIDRGIAKAQLAAAYAAAAQSG